MQFFLRARVSGQIVQEPQHCVSWLNTEKEYKQKELINELTRNTILCQTPRKIRLCNCTCYTVTFIRFSFHYLFILLRFLSSSIFICMQQAYIPPPPAHHYHTLRSIQSNKLILLMSLSPLISLILSTIYFPNVNPTPPLPSHSSHLISHHVMHFPLPINPTSTAPPSHPHPHSLAHHYYLITATQNPNPHPHVIGY